MRAWQEGEGESPAEGDTSMSRSHQGVIQNALNPKNSGRTDCSACLARDELTFGGGSGRASGCV